MIPKINFSPIDLYYIDRVPYHFETSDDLYACLRREDGSGALEWFGWQELNEIVGGDRWDCKRRPSKVEDPQRVPDPLVFIWELTPKQRKLLLYRWFFVCALEKLYAQCLVQLTPENVIQKYYLVHAEATKEWRAFCGEFGQQYYSSKDTSLGATPSASSILKWRRKVSKADGRIDVLLDKRGRASGLNIDQDSYAFIIDSLREYLLDDRHSANEVVEKTIMALKLENRSRKERDERLLQTRGRTALHDWIDNFGGFAIDLGRKGKKFVTRKYNGVGKTERATRAGQTFMVDEWEVDARNLILSGPIRRGLDQETIDAIKAMPKTRRWMYVVVDVATRYIVGFGLSATQNSQSAAARLNIGIKAFEGLVGDGVIEPIKTETSAKPRFESRVIDELLAEIESNLDRIIPNDANGFISIPDACFAVSCTTAKITSLLLSGQLPGSYTVDPAFGFSGIRVNIPELKSRLLMHATTGLTMLDLRERLGLQYSEVKQLTTLKLLPSYSGRKEGSSRPALIVDPTDLAKFLERFQTIRTAAKQLGTDEGAARSRILNSKIYRASEGQGLPIYKTNDIVGLKPRTVPRRPLRKQRTVLQSGASPPYQP